MNFTKYIKQFKLLLHALVNNAVGIKMLVFLSDSESWILNLCFQSRSDGGPEIMKQQHVSCVEGGAEEYKLQGHTQGPEAVLQICLPSPTDRLFSCSRKCQSRLKTKRSWPLGTSSHWEETDLQYCQVEFDS